MLSLAMSLSPSVRIFARCVNPERFTQPPPKSHSWRPSVGLPRPPQPRRYDRLLRKLTPHVLPIPGVDPTAGTRLGPDRP